MTTRITSELGEIGGKSRIPSLSNSGLIQNIVWCSTKCPTYTRPGGEYAERNIFRTSVSPLFTTIRPPLTSHRDAFGLGWFTKDINSPVRSIPFRRHCGDAALPRESLSVRVEISLFLLRECQPAKCCAICDPMYRTGRRLNLLMSSRHPTVPSHVLTLLCMYLGLCR